MTIKNGETINIQDWMGNELYSGPYGSNEVDKVLDANRCHCSRKGSTEVIEDCITCGGDGYLGDFEVNWNDDKIEENVYEYINY